MHGRCTASYVPTTFSVVLPSTPPPASLALPFFKLFVSVRARIIERRFFLPSPMQHATAAISNGLSVRRS